MNQDVKALPELPASQFCAWVKGAEVVNAFPHGVGDRKAWDPDGYWSRKGYDKHPLFTAYQMRSYAESALAELRAEVERLRTQVRNLKEAAATDGLHPSHKVAWADAIDVLRKRNDRLAAVIEKALKALGDIQKLPPEHGMAQNFARKTARELRLMLKEQRP